ncbi:hypothetical protein COCNU_contig69503194G000010 [Cocos nucifera]|nr:hypothetical protein [Cocos nucifera]
MPDAAEIEKSCAFIPSYKGKNLIFNRSLMASPIMAPSSSIFGRKMDPGLMSRFNPSISAHRCRKQAMNRVLAVMAPTQPQRSPATTGSVAILSSLLDF